MNIPGILKIECIPSSKINLPVFVSGEIDLSPYLNGEFIDLDILPGAGPLKASNKKAAAGDYLSITLPFKIPEVSPDNDHLLQTISQEPHAFRVTDVSGKSFLLGAQGIKVQVDFTADTGKVGRTLRGYTCKLKTKALNGLLFLK